MYSAVVHFEYAGDKYSESPLRVQEQQVTGFTEILFARELSTYYRHKLQFSFSCRLVKKDAEKAEHETQAPDSTHQLPCSHPDGSFQLLCTLRSLNAVIQEVCG